MNILYNNLDIICYTDREESSEGAGIFEVEEGLGSTLDPARSERDKPKKTSPGVDQ